MKDQNAKQPETLSLQEGACNETNDEPKIRKCTGKSRIARWVCLLVVAISVNYKWWLAKLAWRVLECFLGGCEVPESLFDIVSEILRIVL